MFKLRPTELVVLIAVGIVTVFGIRSMTAPPELPPPVFTTKYIVFNKKNFHKSDGVMQMQSVHVEAIKKTFETDRLDEIPMVNGFTFESAKSIPESEMGDYVIQRINTLHHYALYELTPANCPVCPGPTPPPVAGFPNTTWGQAMVHAGEASALVDASSIKVCDVDTGLDASVQSQFPPGTIAQGFSMVSGQAWDHDGAGHGTHTAGTIASTKYGVARVKLMICKGLGDNGSGSSLDLGNCVNKCGEWGAQVISASWGMDRGTDQYIGAAIDQFVAKGGIFVAAAGNSSGGPIGFPGNKPNVTTVTAIDRTGRLAAFSSVGDKLGGEMYIAPGVDVLSLWPGGTNTISGTSMATPHVAGIYAYALAKGRRNIGFVNVNMAPSQQGKGRVDALETIRGN